MSLEPDDAPKPASLPLTTKEKFEKLGHANMQQIVDLSNNFINYASTGIAGFCQNTQIIVAAQAQELVFLRQLEEHARNETMTPEIWETLKEELDSFRAGLAAQIEQVRKNLNQSAAG